MASSRNPSVTGRASLASDSTRTAATATTARPGTARASTHSVVDSQYSISAVLAEPHASSSLLPSLPTLPSASSYLPSQLSSLSTTFTSAGTLPKAASGAKSVAQRRSQAPPIHVTDLRKVARTEFDAYLADVSGDFERWQRESRLARDADGRDSAQSRHAPDADNLDADDEGRVGLGVRAAGLAGSPALPPPVSSEVLPALDDVPQIFFDSSFDLANPRTFDLVTERIQLSPYPSPRLSLPSTTATSSSSTAFDSVPGLGPHTLNDLAADQVLQDKLSHYTAVIESHLVREIGLRSSSFFAALSNLQGLHTEGQAALAKITELQSALKASEGGVGAMAQHGLQVLRAQARRRGLERIDEAVRAVEEVWVAVEGVKELVENGEWDGALEVSEQVEDAYYGSAGPSSTAGDATAPSSPRLPSSTSTSSSSATARSSAPRTPTRPLNLTKLRALSSLPTKLALLRAQIAKSLEGELTSVLEHEMDVGIDEHVRLARDGRRWKGKGKALEPPPAGARALHALPEESSSAACGDGDDGASPEAIARERTLERVRPVVSALGRAGGMDSAVVSWRESVLREVRALVREHLPTSEAPTAEDEDHFAQVAVRSVSRGASVDLGTVSEKSVSLAKKLRALPHSAFLALARDTYAGLLACIEVVDLQARILLELWAESRHEEQRRKARRRSGAASAGQNGSAQPADGESTQPAAPAPGATLAVPGSAAELAVGAVTLPPDSSRSSATDDASSLGTDITDVVQAVAELANVRFSKVIGVRTEVHAHLALADFVEIFDLSWSFVVACERVCQRMIVGLRGAMVSQAKTFLQTFHQRQITENARVVEEEQWAAAEVPPETQANIQLILDGATSDPTALLLGERRTARLVAESSTTANGDSTSSPRLAADEKPPVDAEPAKQIDIEGRQFFAVSAGLVTVAVLVEYLKVLANVPMLTTDAMSKIIEFMKVFNSRTCQVVLGAGAMRSAGLKNITAKHLALASQALSIMIALIPYIREAVRRHLNPKQAVMLTEFDKLKRDYQEHQHEIHAKLVAIMSDRLQVHSRSLEGIDFEEPAPRGPDAPNAYMEALVKEHNTLHKVLSRFLATETVAAIMGQVFSALDERLGEVFAHIEPRTRSARDRMLIDVRYLRERLGELKGVEDQGPGNTLEALVSAKPVPEAPAPPPAPAPAPVVTPTKPSALPPRTPSIPPRPDSPSTVSSLAAPSSATPSTAEPAPPVFANARASTSSTSLSSATTATPQPPSPVPVPAALPPSPKPASPAPYVSQKKKKSLAERLAESMGRKAAHAEPEPTAAHDAEAASSAPMSTTAPAQEAPRPASDAAPFEVRAPPHLAGELTPLALERAYENGTGVDTPSLEKALQLEGIELAAGGLATPAREELDEIEKAVEREMARADGAGEDEVRALEVVAQDEEKVGQDEDALASAAEVGVEDERDEAVEASSALAEPAEATAAEAEHAVGAAVDAEPLEANPLAKRGSAALEPAPTADVDAAADGPHEPVAIVDPVVVEQPIVAGEPLADALLSSTSDAPPSDGPASDLLVTETRPLDAGRIDVPSSGPDAVDPDVPLVEVEPASPVVVAKPVENGDAPAAAELSDAPRSTAIVDESSSSGVLDGDDGKAGENVVEPATDSSTDAPDGFLSSVAPTADASVDQDGVVPATAVVAVETASALEPAPALGPSSPTAAPPATAIALEPAPAPPSVVSPALTPSPAPPPAPAAIDTVAPPRRKTLNERLAEAARRGSNGGSGSSLTSLPASPARGVDPPQSPVVLLQSIGGGAGEDKGVLTSPEHVTMLLPAMEKPQSVANELQSSEEKAEAQAEAKVEEKEAGEAEKPLEGAGGPSGIEEEESTFL
ncbi:hypothetical protein JCM9279_000110 [Rhodotorula babjevae]